MFYWGKISCLTSGKSTLFMVYCCTLLLPFLYFIYPFTARRLTFGTDILLIACGSASSWIKRKLINARGDLHNRITQRIKLQPFDTAPEKS
jgi:hypothetical protein